MQLTLWIAAAFVVCLVLNTLPTAWAITGGIVVLFAVRYGTKLYLTMGTGGPPLTHRLFGRIGGNMDGNMLVTFGRCVWEKNRWTGKWKRLCP